MTPEATVFVVDDDDATRRSIQALVGSMGVKTALFESAEAFLDAYDSSQPGCLVTDLRMLGMSGVELQEELNRLGWRIPTILMSAFADVRVTVKAMQLGAITFLEKPCRDMELWDAIRKALADDAEFRTRAESIENLRQRIESLTPQEREVMDMIVDGMMNKTIAKRMEVSLRTVEARRQAVFEKIGASCVADLVRLALAAETSERQSTNGS